MISATLYRTCTCTYGYGEELSPLFLCPSCMCMSYSLKEPVHVHVHVVNNLVFLIIYYVVYTKNYGSTHVHVCVTTFEKAL